MSTNISVVYNDGASDYYLDQFVKSIEWSGDVMQASRKLSLSLIYTLDNKTKPYTIEMGKAISFYENSVLLFHGVVFATDVNQNGDLTLTAYDENIYLNKNEETRKFTNKTASQIIKELCKDFEIPVGTIVDTEYIIPKFIVRDKTLWDTFITALSITQDHKGHKFLLYSWQGKLNLVFRKEQAVKWVIENRVNLLDASYSQTIEETRTKVKLINSSKTNASTTVTTNTAIANKLGIMQHVETVDGEMTPSQMKQMAEELLAELSQIKDTASVNALGNSELFAGKAVYVIEPMTGIVGAYYVITDSHTYEGSMHRMSLTLSATDELPKVDYSDEFSYLKDDKVKKATTKKVKKVDAITQFFKDQEPI